MTGSNFAANAQVKLTFPGHNPGLVAKTAVTDDKGEINPSMVWTVRKVPAGTYVLSCVDDHARYPCARDSR